MSRTYWIQGEPALWLGSGYEPWKQALRDAVPDAEAEPPRGVVLDFHVSSLLRKGHRFDLDNLVTPVFQALLGRRRSPTRRGVEWWRASLSQREPPGLTLTFSGDSAAELAMPTRSLVLDRRVGTPLPSDSRTGGTAFVAAIREGLHNHVPTEEDRFAIELAFGPDTGDITWVEERPLKPVIDCLFPVFGGSPGDPDDWKCMFIQVRRGILELEGACSVRAWRLTGPAAEHPRRPAQTGTPTAAPTTHRPSSPPRRSNSMTNSERLDEAAKQLASPPRDLRLDDIIRRARALYPELESSPRDGLSATMDYQCINVRGRATAPGDFRKSDRWNRQPAFLKVGPGVYRRLSEKEREVFRRRWEANDPLLRRPAFEAAEWDRLVQEHGE